ncbi:MAG: hypothetical protein EXR91_03795 [Gemmatimonadetes bacterium]|nr:hypothetical protein [Gemmatimonadota bacterium]
MATSTDAGGWYAEFRIPFSTLRYAGAGDQTWGMNFSRSIRRRNEESLWAPVPRQYSLYRVSLAGTLSGFQAPARRVVTVTPYALGDVFRDYTRLSSVDCLGSGGRTDCGAQIGGDAKIGLTQSLTLDLTVNTDFAQAEVDDQQVNLTRFPLFFPEKRGFFLENAGTFSVGSGRQAELFFSRRIGLSGGKAVPIVAGARITGRTGPVQVGFLNIQTEHFHAYSATAGAMQHVAPANNFSVARLVREYANRTQLGTTFVSRLNTDDSGDYNLTYGVDGSLGIGEALTVDGWGAMTSTPGMSGGEYGFSGGGEYRDRDWEFALGYHQIGDGFNPEVGFLSRSDYRSVNARILRHIRFPNVPWLREIRPHASWNEYWDMTGFSESSVVHLDNHFEFANGAFFQLPGINITGEGLKQPFEIRPGMFVPAGSYTNLDWQFRANSNQSAALSANVGWDAGGFYTGTRVGPNGSVTYRFQDRLVTQLRVNYFDVRLNDTDKFKTAVVALSGSYSFTPRIYLQAQVQYNDDTENLGTNLRFGWVDTAGTGLYIVYNDTEHYGSLATTGLDSGPLARQLVIKYTKQFDFTR